MSSIHHFGEPVFLIETIEDLLTKPWLESREQFVKGMTLLEAAFELFGMRASQSALAIPLRVAREATQEGFSLLYTREELSKIKIIARSEMQSIKFLQIPSGHAYLYEQEHPYGENVTEAFPSCAFEISESAKCLALYRATAAVLHAMRCLEIVVRVVARRLGVDPNACDTKPIGNLISEMNASIKTSRTAPKSTAGSLERADYLAEVTFRLEAAKDAWRNATSHGRTKFTEAEADAVCFGMKILMQTLAKDVGFHEPKPQSP